MNWFFKWFLSRLERCEEENPPCGEVKATVCRESANDHKLYDGLQVYIKQVVGGRLVTFRTYDTRNDHESTRTYIITDDQEFERELGKVITMESMRL